MNNEANQHPKQSHKQSIRGSFETIPNKGIANDIPPFGTGMVYYWAYLISRYICSCLSKRKTTTWKPVGGLKYILLIFPHILMWGSCFWLGTAALAPPPPPPAASTHTTCSHTTYSHTTCPHTQLVLIQLTHTHNLLTHNLSTHNLPTTWHLATSTFTLRGRRDTWRHRRAFCMARVALMALGWLWWRAWAPFGAVVATAVCAASVALGDIDLHFAW